MTRRPKWLSLLTLSTTAIIVFAACGGTAATPTPPPAATGTPAPAATGTPAPVVTPGATEAPSVAPTEAPSVAPTEAPTPGPTAYPTPGEQPPAPSADITEYPNYGGAVDCAAHTFNGLPYTGNLKKMSAPDASTVVFEFCNPNVAFLAQLAFSALAIDDSQYMIDHMPKAVTGGEDPLPEGSLLTNPNGTGPYMFDAWDRGNRLTMKANPNYWGTAALAPNLEFRWSDQAAQRWIELQAGTVDGIDNPDKADLPAIQGDATVKYNPRAPMNVFYLGMNNTYKPWDNADVRKAIAMGIDRERIVKNFFPPESEVAKYFTPCPPLVPFACEGDDWYKFDATAAKELLRNAGIPEGYEIKLQYRNRVRVYLPDPPTIAAEIASQLETNLGLKVTIEERDPTTYLDDNAHGKLDGLFMLGWGADYPDPTNFLDYHFGIATGDKFGTPYQDIVDVLNTASQTGVEADRIAAYTEANNLIKEHVPAVIVAHGTSGNAWKADVENSFSSPLGTEVWSTLKPGDRDTISWMQNGEPASLYCGDETDGETFRACVQMKESLYAYGGDGGTTPVPALATGCTANDDSTVWTCKLQTGVTFHDGSTFEASDVLVSFAAQWDALSTLHVGRTATFEYWPALIGGGFLNPAGPCGLPNTDPCA
ncbi:MAG: peptide/nickel transport system substrate-binding protein [Chloroflexota bacterium]|jgi:ABC-type transport system substrate-binding protein|nr:peptide/nickel transport system substrate-binding protein [Chloroflexota bacterium]